MITKQRIRQVLDAIDVLLQQAELAERAALAAAVKASYVDAFEAQRHAVDARAAYERREALRQAYALVSTLLDGGRL